MKENKEIFYKHKLCGIDSDHNFVIIYEAETIFEIDCFTSSKFLDRQDMYKKIEERYSKRFFNIFIVSNLQKTANNQKCKYSSDIMFCKNLMPESEKLCNIYADYLLEDRKRIRSSFYYYMPRFKDENLYTISESELKLLVKKRIDSYKKRRDVYFELLKNKKIKEVEIVEKESDYLKSVIDEITLNDEVINKENKTKEDVKTISQDVMLEKVISGQEEPFSYFDLEDFTRHDSNKKGRKR